MKFKVELFLWDNKGLTVTRKEFDDGRHAMDYGYSQPWNVLKVYDAEGDLFHLNTTSQILIQYT